MSWLQVPSPMFIPNAHAKLLRYGVFVAWILSCVITVQGRAQTPDSRSTSPGMWLSTAQATYPVDRPFLEVAPDVDAGRTWTWSSDLEFESVGEYQFAARVCGSLQITVDGTVVLDETVAEPRWVVGAPIVQEAGRRRWSVVLQSAPRDPEAAGQRPQCNIYWKGPGFRWEPVSVTRLTRPPAASEPSSARLPHYDSGHVTFGADLVRVLRCQACHTSPESDQDPLPSPALQRATENLHHDWLVDFLVGISPSPSSSPADTGMRNLHARFDRKQAKDLIAWMSSLADGTNQDETRTSEQVTNEEAASENVVRTGDRDAGRRLLISQGCLACHVHDTLGNAGPYGGGDLTNLVSKRPADFVRRWLADPSLLNAHHRMPQFQLTSQAMVDIDAFLLTGAKAMNAAAMREGDVAAGRRLAEAHACLQCHGPASERASATRTKLTSSSDWQRSCLNVQSAGRPGYGIDEESANAAIQDFLTSAESAAAPPPGEQLVRENNCLQCHRRGQQRGLEAIADDLVELDSDYVDLLAAMRPPALDSVGDKLHRDVLLSVIEGKTEPTRPWLSLQMPRFALSRVQSQQLADHWIAADRVPDEAYGDDQPVTVVEEDRRAGERLVTSRGFGCTSCHPIGRSRPPTNTPLNQLAPNLSMPRQRIRKIWFDRWVRNPARITPRMEMPSVQIPVPGVCGEDLDRQLNAVWDALNRRGFSPPDAEPTRFVILGRRSRPTVLTDVLKWQGRKLIKPFLIGLPNGHNVLFDLERARLAGWWTGVVAQQRTQGKTWFWEPGSTTVERGQDDSDLVFLSNGRPLEPVAMGQFFSKLEQWTTDADGVRLRYQLQFRDPDRTSEFTTVTVEQRVAIAPSGWKREISVDGLGPDSSVGVRATERAHSEYAPQRSGDYWVLPREPDGTSKITLVYGVDDGYQPRDEAPVPPLQKSRRRDLPLGPGLEATQLPLRSDIMPISLGWRPNGELLVGSLKGRVWSVEDADADGLPDRARPLSDELAAPYGIFATDSYIDVVNKHSLIRLHDDDRDGVTDRHQVLASGWGHTDDYHDWVVGLPRDELGNYYVSIPCQQDDRDIEAGKYRGRVLQLRPEGPDRFAIQVLSQGHRFPMGMARNRAGQLFVTDNQGNYNPFNELNHVLPGRHFGFINKLEKHLPPPATVTPPAVAIPHPWTRSVNGICFLESDDRHFGPFEGHLVGCEYDTRRLIRMSLDEVDGWIQGAAYPFVEAAADPKDSLQGPINCAVAPDGDLYVANIRDSGWGGGSNTGSMVRIRFNAARLPVGIATVSAIPDGFRIQFTYPVDKMLAGDLAHYECSSYQRISTPAYGGDDVNRRRETLQEVRVADDGRSVDIILPELRTGFVYEWKLAKLTRGEDPFFPAEAYYSLQRRR